MGLAGNNWLFENLDITGFLSFTRLMDYTCSVGSIGSVDCTDFNWFSVEYDYLVISHLIIPPWPHEPHVEDDFLEVSLIIPDPKRHLLTMRLRPW